jgi:hypothetical protein
MPVILNPFVEKLIKTSELQVMPLVNMFAIEISPSEIAFRLQTTQKKIIERSSK